MRREERVRKEERKESKVNVELPPKELESQVEDSKDLEKEESEELEEQGEREEDESSVEEKAEDESSVEKVIEEEPELQGELGEVLEYINKRVVNPTKTLSKVVLLLLCVVIGVLLTVTYMNVKALEEEKTANKLKQIEYVLPDISEEIDYNTEDMGVAYSNVRQKEELLKLSKESVKRLEEIEEDSSLAKGLEEVVSKEYEITVENLERLEREYTGGFTYEDLKDLLKGMEAILETEEGAESGYKNYYEHYKSIEEVLSELRDRVDNPEKYEQESE